MVREREREKSGLMGQGIGGRGNVNEENREKIKCYGKEAAVKERSESRCRASATEIRGIN